MEIYAKDARKMTDAATPIDKEMNEIFKEIADKAYQGYESISYNSANMPDFKIKKITAKLQSFGYKVVLTYNLDWIKISW